MYLCACGKSFDQHSEFVPSFAVSISVFEIEGRQRRRIGPNAGPAKLELEVHLARSRTSVLARPSDFLLLYSIFSKDLVLVKC